jgi:NADPH-dependent glutamate synthase beta subunit-like oxidoreductase
MEAEGVTFRTSVFIGKEPLPESIGNLAKETISPDTLKEEFDAVVIAGGSETPRDLPVPGRELAGVHFAMDFLPQQNRVNAGDKLTDQLLAKGKHVIVIGGGDTGPTASARRTVTARSRSRSSNCCRSRRKRRTSRSCGRTGRSSCARRRRTRKAASATGRSRRSASKARTARSRS